MNTQMHPEPAAAGDTSLNPAAHSTIPGAAGATTALDRWIGARIQRSIDPASVRLVLWDGSSAYEPGRRSIGDLLVRDRHTLLGLAWNPDLWFGEAYMSGSMEVRGQLEPIVESLSRFAPSTPPWRERLIARFSLNTLNASRHNVHHHYDLGNAFYERWLDRQMLYTCAYFADPEMSLDAAQRAKLDLVCRKLRLRPGDRVIEAGCGWGALALHMARHYGANVRAFNVSREQLAYARARAAREGLSRQVEFIDDDYRNVTGTVDVFVSVGMLEHVGRRHFSTLAGVIARTVRRDGGRGLLHFIGRDVPQALNTWIRRRIFPGAYTPTLGEVTSDVLAPAGMSVIDVENLRLHYARTLAHWGERFASARDEVRQRYGDDFARAWELYLAGSEAAFATGWLQLYQIVFSPREAVPPSWTRADIYDSRGVPA
ncbi:MAG TPA: cyclopropane-fatty-acyl-phospholipid synthase family protein [Vicinamibacterales bacterium]|nr:cyclopropane-fatty-acyl-phospholipid synthase family protein [Vicinamibacterales bacterium]